MAATAADAATVVLNTLLQIDVTGLAESVLTPGSGIISADNAIGTDPVCY